MARKRVLELLILILALPALYLAQLGCEGIEQPEPDKNKEPDTEVTRGPVDSTDAFYRVPLFWKGFDSDGLIQGFEYAMDDTVRSEWVFTTRSDSEFVFLTATDESQLQRRFHRFFVRAIDNEGKEDLTPAMIEFFAETEAAPRSILLRDIAYRLAVSDSKVFVAGGENGLDIYDISDPLAIDHVNTVFTGGVATDILMRDSYVFLADGEKGVTIIDITLPENAQIAGRYPTLGAAAAGLAYEEPYLAVADGTNGIVVLDVSVPEDPRFVARYSPENSVEFVGVAIHEGRVVGLAGEDGVFLLEFRPEASSLRLNPLPEGSPEAFVTWNEALYALVEDGFILVADGKGGLLILEVSADGTMSEHARVPLEGRARALERYGDLVFVANGNCGVCVIDVTDRAAPEIVDHFGFSGDVTGVKLLGGLDTLAVANGDRGIFLLDASDPTNLSSIQTSIVEICSESPSQQETLLAYSSVKFCWGGVSPGGQVVAYRYQLQGVDTEANQVPPDSTTVFYRNLEPKDEYIFTVETKDETGLWSSGNLIAERRFTVNFNPESYIDSIWVTGPYTQAGEIPLTAVDTLLPDSTILNFRWHHTDKDTAQGDSVVGSWWRIGGASQFSSDSIATRLVDRDRSAPLVSSPDLGYTLEIGGIDRFGRRERNGATFRFRVNLPPDAAILSPGVNQDVFTTDSVTVVFQGADPDGPPTNLLYEYDFRTSENLLLDDGEVEGFRGTAEGVIQVRLATFGQQARVVFKVTPIDREGLGKTGPTRSVQFFVKRR